MPVADELGQHTLGQQRIGQIEPRHLVLTWLRGHRQLVEQPLIERPVVLELQRADRMGDALDRIRLAVRIVVARIDRPLVAGARVVSVQDAVEHRVAQIDVARSHVDLGTQHAGAVRELAGLHAAEQVEVLLHRTVTERRVLAGLGQRAAGQPYLLLRLIIDIGIAGLDQALGPIIEALEIVGGVEEIVTPVIAEPVHVGLDGVDVLLLLPGRIGVVEAQIALAAELLRDAEIQGDRLGMPDMQVAVWLRREAGHDPAVLVGGEIGLDDVADEVAPCLCRRVSRHQMVPWRSLADLLPNSGRPAKPGLPA